MAVLSVLRTVKSGVQTLKWPLLRYTSNLPQSGYVALGGPVRRMASGRTMQVMPSNHEVKLFKDHVHFYVLLGAIPLGLIIFCANVFVGKATLSEIPDGYEPKGWEYYRHPIERWFARYCYEDMELSYERLMHKINYEDQKRKGRLLERKVKNLMSERGDYKGWYYIPVSDRRVWVDKANTEDMRENEAIGPVD
ncbi:NADH dehydrogenase [ubiquinone] 1 beta subcomplex subunit 5, mitochondrial-like [Lineus longissimus]|uniref:NADH dehydrogenase [ubiquinone] 1 beta subcomplex subunit 5, mitochondrial-like n=1 Tax=Lineus longissimus TaxID=88925 RepID=UPI00315D5A2F